MYKTSLLIMKKCLALFWLVSWCLVTRTGARPNQRRHMLADENEDKGTFSVTIGSSAGDKITTEPMTLFVTSFGRNITTENPLSLFTISGSGRVDVLYSQEKGILYVLAFVANASEPGIMEFSIPEGVTTDEDGARNQGAYEYSSYAPSSGYPVFGYVVGWTMFGAAIFSLVNASFTPKVTLGVGMVNFVGFVQVIYMVGNLPITNMPWNYRQAAQALDWVGLNPSIGPIDTDYSLGIQPDVYSTLLDTNTRFPRAPIKIQGQVQEETIPTEEVRDTDVDLPLPILDIVNDTRIPVQNVTFVTIEEVPLEEDISAGQPPVNPFVVPSPPLPEEQANPAPQEDNEEGRNPPPSEPNQEPPRDTNTQSPPDERVNPPSPQEPSPVDDTPTVDQDSSPPPPPIENPIPEVQQPSPPPPEKKPSPDVKYPSPPPPEKKPEPSPDVKYPSPPPPVNKPKPSPPPPISFKPKPPPPFTKVSPSPPPPKQLVASPVIIKPPTINVPTLGSIGTVSQRRRLMIVDPVQALGSSGFSYTVVTATPGSVDDENSTSAEELEEVIGSSVLSRIRTIQNAGNVPDADQRRLDVLWNVLFWSAMALLATFFIHACILLLLRWKMVDNTPKMLHLPRIELVVFMVIIPMICAAGCACLQSTSAGVLAAGVCLGVIVPFGYLIIVALFIIFAIIQPNIEKRRALYLVSRRDTVMVQSNSDTSSASHQEEQDADELSESVDSKGFRKRIISMYSWIYKRVLSPIFGFSSPRRAQVVYESVDASHPIWYGPREKDSKLVKRFGCFFEDAHGPQVLQVCNSTIEAKPSATDKGGIDDDTVCFVPAEDSQTNVEILQTFGVLFALTKLMLFAAIINAAGGVNNVGQVVVLVILSLLHIIYLRYFVPYRLRIELAAEILASLCDLAVFICGIILIAKDVWTTSEGTNMGIAMLVLQAVGFLVFISVRVGLALRTFSLTLFSKSSS